ncbi:hypothetical protein N9878_00765 [bacterium]|nr:hypothetical protein [bacterium]
MNKALGIILYFWHLIAIFTGLDSAGLVDMSREFELYVWMLSILLTAASFFLAVAWVLFRWKGK